MIQLPNEYKKEIEEILGQDAERFEKLMQEKPYRGISVNRLKITPEKLLPLLPFEVRRSPFYRDGFYLPDTAQGLGNHPLHRAGAFYVQEPSAASAVSLLNVQKGDRVLDLCAAPGGKSAQIASCLAGTGLIWSNEIVKSRAQILLSNFERMGIIKGVVSSLYPEILCERLQGFFDKVLVDAPCSGEGMFRKNPEAIGEWSREHVKACAERQLSILNSAAKALRDGGTLVYSTCTFSHEENEGVIEKFLSRHPEFEAAEAAEPFGRKTGVSCGVRITPCEEGEGHFAAKLHRKGDSIAVFSENSRYDKLPDVPPHSKAKTHSSQSKQKPDLSESFIRKELNELLTEMPEGNLTVVKDKALLMPKDLPDLTGCGVIRAGVLVGEMKKNRFEPAHSLFMALPPSCFRRVLTLPMNDQRIGEFLQGFEIDCEGENGYTAVAPDGMMNLGFGKCSDGRLKNKYPKGLRGRTAALAEEPE